MKRINIFVQILIFLSLIFTLVSCEVEVPIREIIDAKTTIDRAYEVKAEKYSDKNFTKAIESLYECHTFLKNDKIDEAKKSAEKSKQSALMAINESLPLLSNDTLTEATNIYNNAEIQNALIFAPDEFKKTDDAIKEADKLHKDTKYWESYQKSKEAIISGKAASEKSLATIPGFKSKIEQLAKEYEGLKVNELSNQAENELTIAKTEIDKAKTELDEKKLKNISTHIEIAEKNLKQAKVSIDNVIDNEKKLAEAKEKINKLTKDIEAIKTGRGKDFATDDINKAESSLGEANELISKKKANEAMLKIVAAESNIKEAQSKTQKGISKEKLDAVANLYANIKAKDSDNKFKENLDKADAIILSSRKSFEDGSYDESISKSNEAESILNSISISLGKLDDEKKVTVKEGDKDKEKVEILIEEKPTYYVVKYRKKDTDCLWRIAMTVYRDAKLWPLIYKANRDQIKDPDLIFPGQKFMIPSIEKRKGIKKEVEEIRKEIIETGDKGKKDTKKTDTIKNK